MPFLVQAIYSTSETEEEYQAYMKAKPKWHGKGGHKDSWDPLQIASPPQIVQRPVGVVQKPKPQAKVPQKIERGAQVYPASLQIYPGPQGTNGQGLNGATGQQQEETPSAFSVPKNYERIQKSDSIIEMKMVGAERIQKSTSVVEVVPSRLAKKDASPNPQTLPSMKELSPIQQIKKEPSPFQQPSLQPMKEASPYQHQPPTSPPSLATKELSPTVSRPVPVLSSMPSSASLPTSMDVHQRVASPPTLDSLQVPTSPQDSEDQATPQAPRKFYMPKQTSVESTNSFSENDELENQSAALKSIREDPETTKKKEIHKNLMSEALQKVELRKKNPNFSQMARTNPTLASLNIATRKELKMEEMEAKMEQEDTRGRHKSGSYGDIEPPASSAVSSSVNNNVLDTFRAQSIHKGTGSGQNGASRQAAIAAKKAGTPKKAMTPVKPDILPKPVTLEPRVDVSEPVVILRKQPRILEPSEIKARVEEQSKGRLLSPLPHQSEASELSLSHTCRTHTQTPHMSARKKQVPVPLFLPSSFFSTTPINPDVQGRATEGAVSPSVSATTNANVTTTTSRSEKRVQDSNSVSQVQTLKAVKSEEKRQDGMNGSGAGGVRGDPKDKVTTVAKTVTSEAGVQRSIPSLSNAEREKASEGTNGISPAARLAQEMAQQPDPKTLSQRKPEAKESQAAKALEKINAAQQALKQQRNAPVVAKQALEGMMHVTPKTSNSQPIPASNSQTVPEQVIAVSLPRTKMVPTKEMESPKIATVRRAAERFERHTALMNSKSVSDLTIHSAIRGRSKSIGDALRTRFVEDQEQENKAPCWAGKSPPAARRKEGMSKGYALQMSKSCDSITAAKMLAKARAENSGHARINQNFSKSIERQIDVYSKTKEDIRKILDLAKGRSIKDRVSLFDNLKDLEPEPVDPDVKAEAIRMEIVNARAQARAESQESVSDGEIELKSPIESKVKPISRKPSMSEKGKPASSGNTLRINQTPQDSPRRERRPSIEDLPSVRTKIKSYIDTTADEMREDSAKPKPILKTEKERSRSPRKSTKAPKLLGDHFLSPNQSVQIYAQSATDLSATEDEGETSRREPPTKKLSVVLADQPEPGPILLQVPPKPSAEARPGIMKSKSFASSSSTGQFECSIDESSGKKMQMMAFFGQGGEKQPQKTVRIKERQTVVKSSSINSVTDEMMPEDEEDLQDIDAEFESLLNKTFEKESRRLMTADESEAPARRSREKAGKSEESAGSQTRRGGRGTVSLDMSNSAQAGHFQQHLRKSNSVSGNSGAGLLLRATSRDESSVSGSEVGAMYPSPVIRQKNFDPVGSLPSSSGRREGQTPSPTQSEYDTCDPWDDY